MWNNGWNQTSILRKVLRLIILAVILGAPVLIIFLWMHFDSIVLTFFLRGKYK